MRTAPTKAFIDMLDDALSAETIEERVDALEAITIMGQHCTDFDDPAESTCALIAYFAHSDPQDRGVVLKEYDVMMRRMGLPTYGETINRWTDNLELLAAYGVKLERKPDGGNWLEDYDQDAHPRAE